MKVIFFILLSFTTSSLLAQQWQRQSSPTQANLTKVFFIDSLTGYAAGDSGKVLKTINGGSNWIIVPTPINFVIDDIFFLNANTGWAVANEFFFTGSTILKTTTGGLSWQTHQTPDTTLFRAVHFLNAQTGFIGGLQGHIFKTTNGGASYFPTAVDTGLVAGLTVWEFDFYNDQYGFASGGHIDVAGVIWKTTNGGLFWSETGVSPEPVYDIVFIDSLKIMGVGGDYEFGGHTVKTTDAGVNWTTQSMFIFGEGHSFAMRTEKEVWVPMSFAETMAFSDDTGRSFIELFTPDSMPANDIQFPDSTHGWMVGDYGFIAKYIHTTVGIEPAVIIQDFELDQNYPNPFNPFTTISFTLKKGTVVKLNLFDVNGKLINTLINSYKNAGSYKIEFDGSILPTGTYFYNLSAGDHHITKKMVLLK